ncbi:MAG: tetratricopeptide repeat protein, partial [Candidatus Polarisedimenticolia bacterium]
ALLGEGLKARPDDPSLLCALAEAQLAKGDAAAAEASARKAREKGAPAPRAAALEATALARQLKFEAAAKAAEAGRLALGDETSADAETLEAVALVAAPEKKHATPAEIAARGAALVRLGLRAEGAAALKKALAADPTQPAAAAALAASRAAEGAKDEALAILSAARVGGAKEPAFLAALGAAQVAAGHVDEALAPLAEAADAGVPGAASQLGRALASRPGRDEAAAEALEGALDEAPEDAAAWFALALLRRAAGDGAAAKRAFAEALRCDTAYVRAAAAERRDGACGPELARAYLEQGLFRDAAEVAAALLAAKPDDGETLFIKGKALAGLERWDEAERALRRGIEVDHGRHETWLELAALSAQQGRWPDAASLLIDLTAAAPELADAHVALGMARLEEGERDQALVSFRRALECDGSHPLALLWLGRSSLMANDKATARVAYRRLKDADITLARRLFYEIHR